jgi:hypothetical protein
MNMEDADSLEFTIIEVIALETDLSGDEKNDIKVPLIGTIESVRITNDRIFLNHRISDMNTPLCVYDRKGRFLWSTKRGKGPGEILEAQRIATSPSGSKVCLLQGSKYVFEYSKDGEFLRKVTLPMSSTEIEYYSDDVWVIKPSLWKTPEYSFYYFDGDQISPFALRNTFSPNLSMGRGELCLTVNQGQITYTHNLTDSIFSISKDNSDALYVFDFQPKGLDDVNYREMMSADIPYNWLLDKGIAFQDSWIYRIDETLYFGAIYNMSRYVCSYNIDNSNFKASRWDDLKIIGILYNWSRFKGYSEESIVLSISAYNIVELKETMQQNLKELKPEFSKTLSSIKETDNPLLVLVK